MTDVAPDKRIRTVADYREASPCPAGYLNFAAIGPLLTPVVAARRDAETILTDDPGRLSDLDPIAERGRLATAKLLGFDEIHVVLAPNTSTGLFQAAFAMPAGEVLVSPFDFPANTAPWRRAAEVGRITVRWLADPAGPRPRITPELIASTITTQTVAVSVSAVDFTTGECVDLTGIRHAIGDRLLIVDAIQGFGVADLPWSQADLVTSGGQKWIRAGWGTGVLACSDRAIDRLGAGLSGWSGAQGAEDPSELELLPQPRPDAGRFSITPPDMIAMAGFAAAVDALHTIGMPAINAQVRALVEHLRAGLVARAGAEINGEIDRARCSGITSFTLPGHPAAAIVAALQQQGVIVAERQGNVRVSIHASTTQDEIDHLVAAVTTRAHGART